MTAPTQNINTHQKVRVHVTAFDFDGQLDTTSVLTAASTNSSNATASIAPDDPRAVDIVAGNNVSNVNIIVNSPVGGTSLTIPVAISAAPNLAHVDFASADPPTLK
jgi:hypothetical protein